MPHHRVRIHGAAVGTKWSATDHDMTISFGAGSQGSFNIDTKTYNDVLWWQNGDAVRVSNMDNAIGAPCFQLQLVDGELRGDYFSAAEAHHHVTLLKA